MCEQKVGRPGLTCFNLHNWIDFMCIHIYIYGGYVFRSNIFERHFLEMLVNRQQTLHFPDSLWDLLIWTFLRVVVLSGF